MKSANSKFRYCLYFSSNALARKMERMAAGAWKPVGLSPSHGYVLLLALERPGIQPTEIAEQLLLSPSTITRLLEKLEQQKWVVRTMDGKITNVYPTPLARKRQPELEQCTRNFYTQYSSLLGEKASNELVGQMNKLTDKLE